MKPLSRYRRHAAWLCALGILLMGLTAQQHALSHALGAVHAAAKHQAPAGPDFACDQCLQIAATDGLLSSYAVALLLTDAAGCPAGEGERRACAEAFTAYASRAPPAA